MSAAAAHDFDLQEPAGRQPFTCYIAPSKPYPWYGSVIGGRGNPRSVSQHADIFRVGGERFTAEQMRALKARGIDAQQVEAITVKRQATDREIYFGGAEPPVMAFDCPVLGRRAADGAPHIITPSGDLAYVRPDGWVKRPALRKRMPW